MYSISHISLLAVAIFMFGSLSYLNFDQAILYSHKFKYNTLNNYINKQTSCYFNIFTFMDTCNEIYDVKTIFMNDNYNCTMYYGVSFNTYYEANNLFKNLKHDTIYENNKHLCIDDDNRRTSYFSFIVCSIILIAIIIDTLKNLIKYIISKMKHSNYIRLEDYIREREMEMLNV